MNAVILAAGTASRFVPLSEEIPKGLLEIHGEIIIERLIRQLREAGVADICIVIGYKAELFQYLAAKFNVSLVYNEDYQKYNNTSSVIRILDRLEDTFICCSDHYYVRNVFLEEKTDSYYAAQFSKGQTNEWCLKTDDADRIVGVEIGGSNAWFMAGHAYFNPFFSGKFRDIFQMEYQKEEIRQGYWEGVLIRHLAELPMKICRFSDTDFKEFDSIDELRQFDTSYITNTRSHIVKEICSALSCKEEDLTGFKRITHIGDYLMFSFQIKERLFEYDGCKQTINEVIW